MLIGIISDTHNDIESIRKSIEFFNLRNTDIVLHCGDIYLPSAAKEFSKLNCGFKAVFGNNDIEKAELINIISDFGMIEKAPFEFKISGKKFIMMHMPYNLDTLAKKSEYDYILYGHSHKVSITKHEKSTIINPGEACGRRYGRKTIALLDLILDHIEIFDLGDLI